MPIKTLVTIVFDSTEAEWLIESACTLARALDAHLSCLHPHSPVVFLGGMGMEPIVYASWEEWEADESSKVRQIFEEKTRRHGVLGDFRRQILSYASERFLLSGGRGADLMILGSHGDRSRSPDDSNLAERVIRNLGRPVLVLSPNAMLSGPAGRILVGWNETRQATRAGHDALALAQPGATIELVALLARAKDEEPSFDSRDDFAAAVHRRGFKAVVTDRMAPVENRGEELLQMAMETQADILALGAFGHSQFYDLMIGSVTGHMLRSAKMPVLFSA